MKRDYFVITLKARLIRVGNSRGVRLPKAIIEQAGLGEEVELTVENNRIVIARAEAPRTGWAVAAQKVAAEQGGLLDAHVPTRFDENEWQW